MGDADRKALILRKVDDLVTRFVWGDRQEDEDLSAAELYNAINSDVCPIDEIVDRFRKGMEGAA